MAGQKEDDLAGATGFLRLRGKATLPSFDLRLQIRDRLISRLRSASEQWCRGDEQLCCKGNLSHFPAALMLSAGEEAYPDDILVAWDYLGGTPAWSCPSRGREHYPSTKDQVAEYFAYIYVGAGVSDKGPDAARTVILYDRPGNHDGKWITVLLASGHLEGFPASDIAQLAEEKDWIVPRE